MKVRRLRIRRVYLLCCIWLVQNATQTLRDAPPTEFVEAFSNTIPSIRGSSSSQAFSFQKKAQNNPAIAPLEDREKASSFGSYTNRLAFLFSVQMLAREGIRSSGNRNVNRNKRFFPPFTMNQAKRAALLSSVAATENTDSDEFQLGSWVLQEMIAPKPISSFSDEVANMTIIADKSTKPMLNASSGTSATSWSSATENPLEKSLSFVKPKTESWDVTTTSSSSLSESLGSKKQESPGPTPDALESPSSDQLRIQSAEVTHSFVTHDFEPAWFATNPHFQTIMGVLNRQDHSYFPTVGNLALSRFQYDSRERLNTADGLDVFDVDWKYMTQDETKPDNSQTQTPVVIICHGLESNSNSSLVRDMAIAFNTQGMDTASINCRGSSGEVNQSPLGYHLGYTDDLMQLIQHVQRLRPSSPIYLSGFSMGANHVTQLLSKLGADAFTRYNIAGAAVTALPTDFKRANLNIDVPDTFGNRLYGSRILKSLKQRTLESIDAGVQYNFTKEQLLDIQTLKDYDNLVVCSVYEFEDVYDYYNRTSASRAVLENVMVPELVIQARDDPFFAGAPEPANDPQSSIHFQYTKHGGHCGYMFANEDTRAVTGWMPTQMARFLKHVHNRRHELAAKNMTSVLQKTIETDPRRKEAAMIANEFIPGEYKPAWFSRNDHFQTIMGALKRNESMYTNPFVPTFLWRKKEKIAPLTLFEWDTRQRIETPDGDFFDVDWKYAAASTPSEEAPLVLICHGLQSDSTSPLVHDLASAFNNVGMDAACINFRGCGGEINRTPRGYHLGFTDDLKQMISIVNERFPDRRIYLSGFSLGANVVTKCLTEMGDTAYAHHVCGAAVNAVPFEMTKANVNLNEDGLSKSLYGGRLLDSMVQRIEDSYDAIDFDFPKSRPGECKTIRDMEDLVIAPVFGFKDAWDYYEKTSTLPFLDQVAVPEYIIQSKDDPFFAGQTNPANDIRRPLRISYTNHGGHCGYVFHTDNPNDAVTSWMPTELARFLNHVNQNMDRLVSK